MKDLYIKLLTNNVKTILTILMLLRDKMRLASNQMLCMILDIIITMFI